MASFETDCIFEYTYYRLYKKIREPKLFRYANKGQWDRIPERCRKHPKEAKFVHKYPPCDTALHRVLRVQPQEPDLRFSFVLTPRAHLNFLQTKNRAVAALIEAFGDAASRPNCAGQTPLHLACMDLSNSLDVVKMILIASPTSASVQDKEGRTPLHYLCLNHRICLDVMERVIAAYPKATSITDKYGCTPLHLACMTFPSSAPTAESVGVPNDESQDSESWEPLHFTSHETGLHSEAVIQLLSRSSPQSVFTDYDNNKMTPILHALRHISDQYESDGFLSGDHAKVLRVLIDSSPDLALCVDDKVAKLVSSALVERVDESDNEENEVNH